MELPENIVATDLYWWRNGGGLHTNISWSVLDFDTDDELGFWFYLFDETGALVARWSQEIKPLDAVMVGSERPPLALDGQALPSEGLLAVFLVTKDKPSELYAARARRLYGICDWYSLEGELVSLHSDQLVDYGEAEKAVDFTEVVVDETKDAKHYLTVLNGFYEQKLRSVELTLENHRRETRSAHYEKAIQPFTVNHFVLRELFPDILSFADGKPLTIKGSFRGRGVYMRPYVMCEAAFQSGYHAGDLYHWQSVVPRTVYKILGRGEVNPMMVVNNESIETTVNIFNTHGNLEENFAVDARLYDEGGALVAERKQWLEANRAYVDRGSVRDLLPSPNQPFVGYIALSFTDQDRSAYPVRLQALLEYKTSQNVTRVMAWSDQWNSDERQFLARKFQPMTRAFYRVSLRDPIETFISITNAGTPLDYQLVAPYRLLLQSVEGTRLEVQGELQPHQTHFRSLFEFFPELPIDFSEQRFAMLSVLSSADLASVHIDRHKISGVQAAEHFMAAPDCRGEEAYWPSGN